MTPSSGSLSARPAASATPGRFFNSTIGRAGSESAFSSSGVTSQTLRAASAFAIMTANGLPPRRFPSRSRAIAPALRASHTRWNPPSPFTATTCPAPSSSTARAMRASDTSRVFPQVMHQPSGRASEATSPAPRVGKSSPGIASQSGRHAKERCGPHSKHASGCAWKRRSSGSAYSAAQRSHMGKSFMDVLARS